MTEMPYSFDGSGLNRITKKTEVWRFDLNPLGLGDPKVGTTARPALTRKLLPAFREISKRGSPNTAYANRFRLLYFWKFLDHQERLSASLDPARPLKIDDLSWSELEALWRHFLDWLRAKSDDEMGARSSYSISKFLVKLLTTAHALEFEAGMTDKEYLDIYVYFSSSQSSSYNDDDALTYDEAKRAFKVLAGTWRGVLHRIRSGQEMARQGCDPMTGSSGRNLDGGPWQRLHNRLWVVKEIAPFAKNPQVDASLTQRVQHGMRYPIPAGTFPKVFGFDDCGTGLWCHVVCVYPGLNEMMVALAMVSMKSGMNPDVIAGMRVDNWQKPDPMYPDKRVIIFGPKRIAGHTQRASSSVYRKTDPYQIIMNVIELLAPFRRLVARWAEETSDPKLREMSELIWIFPTQFGVGHFLPGNGTADRGHQYLDNLMENEGVVRDNGQPLKYRISKGRDIWGLFVYHKSGFNYILTAQALGHSSLLSLLHYLEKRILKVADRKRLIELHGRVITDLRDAKYSPRQYREARGGTVRSATGLECTDPTHPAPDADPGNPGGQTCRSQGCWACLNWYATVESLPYLLRMIRDLGEMRETSPVAVWETSDYSSMTEVYTYIVSRFHNDLVARAEKEASRMPPIISTSRFTTAARGAM